MPLLVNLRHLENQELRLTGELAIDELDLERLDDLIHPSSPLRYQLLVERHEKGLLVQGQIELQLACECARCLRPFEYPIRLPNYCCLLPWNGDDAMVVRQDCVDLTPYLREDIVLALPQKPLCEPDCGGLGSPPPAATGPPSAGQVSEPTSPEWATLNKLKL